MFFAPWSQEGDNEDAAGSVEAKAMNDDPQAPGGRGPLSPELIERLRQTGIRLDREGRFWHEGQVVSHPRFYKTLLRWLDLLDDGRPILRLDDKRYAYVEVDDAMLLVLSLRWEGDRAMLTLNDESEEELAYDTLEQAPDHAIYCRVRGKRLSARLTTPAYYQLTQHIREDEDGFFLEANGGRYGIPPRVS